MQESRVRIQNRLDALKYVACEHEIGSFRGDIEICILTTDLEVKIRHDLEKDPRRASAEEELCDGHEEVYPQGKQFP